MMASGYILQPDEGVRTVNETYNEKKAAFKPETESNSPPQESAYEAGDRAFDSLGIKRKEDGDPRHDGFAAGPGSV